MTPQEMKQLAELLQNVPGIKSIELKDVKGLAQLLRESPEIGSIEIKGWFGTGVVITRTSRWHPVRGAVPVPRRSARGDALRRRAETRAAAAPPAAAPALKEIKSPMVGTFYRAPGAGRGPYVKVGSRVSPRADGVHHRSDEDHERDRGRDHRRRPRGLRRGRAARRVRSGALPGGSQWLSRPRRAPRARLDLQFQERHRADGAAQRVRPAAQGGPAAHGPRERRAARAGHAAAQAGRPQGAGRAGHDAAPGQGVRREEGGGLRDRRARRGPVPDQHLPAARHARLRLPRDSLRGEDDPRAHLPPVLEEIADEAARAWCWSPASPARASPRRSPR